jgi:predicted benzoate:H+ symporter BenE
MRVVPRAIRSAMLAAVMVPFPAVSARTVLRPPALPLSVDGRFPLRSDSALRSRPKV